jgi:hypothetical protein
MQTTEKRLDMVWNKYDAHLKFHLKPEAHALLQSAWPARNELQRTPDWNEAENSQKGKKKAPPGEYIPPTESAQKTDATFTLPTRKEKPQTRGSATTEPAPAEDQTSALRRAHIIATIHTHQETIPHLLNTLPPALHNLSAWRGTLDRLHLGNEHNKLPTRETLWLGMALHAQGW